MGKKKTDIGRLLYEVRKYLRALKREPIARQLEMFPSLNQTNHEVQKKQEITRNTSTRTRTT